MATGRKIMGRAVIIPFFVGFRIGIGNKECPKSTLIPNPDSNGSDYRLPKPLSKFSQQAMRDS